MLVYFDCILYLDITLKIVYNEQVFDEVYATHFTTGNLQKSFSQSNTSRMDVF